MPPTKVTMEDIASKAGVTRATVSMVFSGKQGISQATRDRVFQLAQEMKYRKPIDRQVRGRTHYGQIGLVMLAKFPPVSGQMPGSSYLQAMTNGMMTYAQSHNSAISLCRLSWDDIYQKKLPPLLQRMHVDGVILRGELLPEVEQWLADLALPYVLLDCDRHMEDCLQIQIDNMRGMELLVEHLYQSGARQFATITGEMEHINGRQRLAGLQTALNHRDVPLLTENIVLEQDFTAESGRRGIKALLERESHFDALVCANDLIARAAIRELIQAGRRVPEDVRVVGFDNMEIGHHSAVPITTIDPKLYEMGQLGAQLLLEAVGDEQPRSLHVTTPVQLVARESSCITEEPETGSNSLMLQGATK